MRGSRRSYGRCPVLRAITLAAALAVVVLMVHPRANARAPQMASAPGTEIQLWAGPPGPPVLVTSDLTERIRAGGAVPESANIVVTYDAGFPANASIRNAFEFAVNVWEAQLTSPITIRVTARWIDQCAANGKPPGCGLLGSGGTVSWLKDFTNAPRAGTWYPVALANKLAGVDLEPANSDIAVAFDNQRSDWYFGTDGHPAANQYDFISAALHELAHGFGIAARTSYTQGKGSLGYGGYPTIWDRFVMNGSGVGLWGSFANGSSELGSQLTSNDLYWSGLYGIRGAGGGSYPKLYAPFTWQGGSSYSHLDENTYPRGNANVLMSASLGGGEANHDPGPIVRGVLRDSGWTVASLPPVHDLAISFQGAGTWRAAVNGSGWAWTELHGLVFGPMAAGDFDSNAKEDLLAYVPGSGIWIRYDSGVWRCLHTLVPSAMATGDLDANGQADIVFDFDGSGAWKWMNNGTWVSLHGLNPAAIATGDFDGHGRADVMIAFPGSGTWIYSNNHAWSNLHSLAAVKIVTGDFDGAGRADAVIDFGASGLWLWMNQGIWAMVHSLSPGTMTAGDFDGDGAAELAMSFAGYGIYVWDLTSGWRHIHSRIPQSLLADDLDGNGQAELVIDFGVSVWAWMNNGASWRAVHSLDAAAMATGTFR